MTHLQIFVVGQLMEVWAGTRPMDDLQWLCDLLQATIADSGDGTPSPLCPVHVTSEIDPLQEAE